MTNSNQTELFPTIKKSTLLREATLANLSASQVEKKVKKIQDTSGQSILDLSRSSGQLGSLERTLVDTLNSVWTPYSRTWRIKCTQQGRLVFQLRASVRTTKEKESGLWQTPTAVGINKRSQEALERKKGKRLAAGRSTVPPGSLMEQIQLSPEKDQQPKWDIFPTPVSSDGTTGAIIGKDDKFKLTKNGNLRKINRNKKDGSLGLGRRAVLGILENPEKIKEMNLEEGKYQKLWPTPSKGMHKQDVNDDGRYAKWVEEKGYQVMLPAAVKLEDRETWPTPVARDHKDLAWNPTWKERRSKSLPQEVAKKEFFPTPNASDNRDRGNLSDPAIQRRIAKGKQIGLSMRVKERKGGGTLNPTWVEWIMGYPSGWTDLNASATVSSPTSPTTSDAASSNRIMWPTPMARSHLMPRKPETMAKTGRNPLTNTLEDAVQHREIWPTPTVGMVEGGEQSDRVEKTEKGSYILRKKNKPDSTFGAKLSDAILFEEKKKMWPTPRATNINESYETANKRMEKRKKEGRVTGGVRNLATEVQMWPTPRANNIVNKKERLSPEGRLSKDGKQRFGLNLQDAVTMWPTPTAHDGNRRDKLESWKKRRQRWKEKGVNLHKGLNIAVALEEEKEQTMWPTPIASGARRSEGAINQMRKKVDAGEITKEEAEKMLGGSLTPKRMKPWTPKNGRK